MKLEDTGSFYKFIDFLIKFLDFLLSKFNF